MNRRVIPILLAVFLVGTLSTGFAVALMTSGQPGSLVVRAWRGALQYGWPAGITVTGVVFFVHLRPRRDRTKPDPRPSD